VKFQFIAEQSQQYSITLLCKALEVSESGYYAWKGRKASHHCREDAKLAAEIQQIFLDHRQVYGSPRIHALLKARGAADAPVGLVGWTETFAQTDHQKRSASSICSQSSQSGVYGRAAK